MLKFTGRDAGTDIFTCSGCGKKEFAETGRNPADVPHVCKPIRKG